MAVIPLPMLSSIGWARAPADKADGLMSHTYESDMFQSYIYNGNITSLQGIIEQFGHDIPKCCREIERAYTRYFERYYDSASVQCVEAAETEATSETHLRFYCSVVEEGKEYVIARLIVSKDSKFQRVIKLNNEGNTL